MMNLRKDEDEDEDVDVHSFPYKKLIERWLLSALYSHKRA